MSPTSYRTAPPRVGGDTILGLAESTDNPATVSASSPATTTVVGLVRSLSAWTTVANSMASGNTTSVATGRRASSNRGMPGRVHGGEGEERRPRADEAQPERPGGDRTVLRHVTGPRPHDDGDGRVHDSERFEQEARRSPVRPRATRSLALAGERQRTEARHAGDEQHDPRHGLPASEVEHVTVPERGDESRRGETEHGRAQPALADPALLPGGPPEDQRRRDIARADERGQRSRRQRPREEAAGRSRCEQHGDADHTSGEGHAAEQPTGDCFGAARGGPLRRRAFDGRRAHGTWIRHRNGAGSLSIRRRRSRARWQGVRSAHGVGEAPGAEARRGRSTDHAHRTTSRRQAVSMASASSS